MIIRWLKKNNTRANPRMKIGASPRRRNTLTWCRTRSERASSEKKKQHRRCDWINLSICQLHGWVCLVAAARGRVSVHRSRTDRRLVEFVFSARVREIARRATHVRARVHHRLRAYTCVIYVTTWLGAQIQRAQLAHRTQKWTRRRKRRIVLILRLRRLATEPRRAWLLSASSKNPIGLHEMLRAKNKASPQSLLYCRILRADVGESKRRILQYSPISSQKHIWSHFFL